MKPEKWTARILLVLAVVMIVVAALALHPANQPTPEEKTATGMEADSEDLRILREAMVERARNEFNLKNEAILEAMRRIPRHLFVPEDYRSMAYSDSPLPIGYGQTISAPYMAAWMTEELELKPGDRVLEIGTGSGYQAAVLAELGTVEVYSVEILPELADRAAALLSDLGYREVHLEQRDGYFGWEDHAPYNAIIVTAAPDHLPAPLIQQLADGGRLLIPIGPVGGYQTLWKFRKEGSQIKGYNLGGVAFVPLVSQGKPQPQAIPTSEE